MLSNSIIHHVSCCYRWKTGKKTECHPPWYYHETYANYNFIQTYTYTLLFIILLCFTSLCRGLMKHWHRIPAASSMSMQCSLIASAQPTPVWVNFVSWAPFSLLWDLSTFIVMFYRKSQQRNSWHDWSDIPTILMRDPQKLRIFNSNSSVFISCCAQS